MIEDGDPCPCTSGRDHGSCCRPIHRNDAGLGTTAEQLMRARYTAYVLHDADFLLRSWHPDSRPATLDFGPDVTWHGLTVVGKTGGGGLEHTGTVEFRARFDRRGEPLELHELSSFVRVGGRWCYVDGSVPDQSGPPRSTP